jgi:hypothetical protein
VAAGFAATLALLALRRRLRFAAQPRTSRYDYYYVVRGQRGWGLSSWVALEFAECVAPSVASLI